MLIKTSELNDIALDFAVAQMDPRCEGLAWKWRNDMMVGEIEDGIAAVYLTGGKFITRQRLLHREFLKHAYYYSPSAVWADGGPIIEREKIWLKFPFGVEGDVEAIHGDFGFPNVVNASGPTALIASMRCYVLAKLGVEVEIPEELCVL